MASKNPSGFGDNNAGPQDEGWKGSGRHHGWKRVLCYLGMFIQFFVFFFFYLATEFIMCLTLWHIRILTGAEELHPPQPHSPGLGLFEAREVSAASQALSTMFCN